MDETHPLKKTENISVKSILLSNKKILLNYVIRRIVMETPGFSEMNHTQPQFRKCGFLPHLFSIILGSVWKLFARDFPSGFYEKFFGDFEGNIREKKIDNLWTLPPKQSVPRQFFSLLCYKKFYGTYFLDKK
jgi:hypothetical protein